jgi:hypothetical protein
MMPIFHKVDNNHFSFGGSHQLVIIIILNEK